MLHVFSHHPNLERREFNLGGEMELKQAVYTSLLTQIQFEAYINMGKTFLEWKEYADRPISVDTGGVKAAYHRLRQGRIYLTVSKKQGKSSSQVQSRRKDRLIQDFFCTEGKTALIDLSRSIWPLFGWAGWLSLKHTPPDVIGQLAHMDIQSPNAMYQYLEQKFRRIGKWTFKPADPADLPVLPRSLL